MKRISCNNNIRISNAEVTVTFFMNDELKKHIFKGYKKTNLIFI